jgi:hypothetical protein
MSQWDFTGPPPGPPPGQPPGQARGFGEYDEYGEFHEYADSETTAARAGYSDDFEGGAFSPISYERDPYEPPWEPAAPPRPTRPTQSWPDESWPPRVPRRQRLVGPRWLLPVALVALIAAGAGTAAALLGAQSGRPSAGAPSAGGPSAGAPSAGGTATGSRAAAHGPGAGTRASPQPLTMAQARSVLAAYTSANNAANATRSAARLAAIETGSSYAIDTGIYRVQQAEKAAPYPAFGPRQARFYIPGEAAAAYPHWFAVQVANAELASPGKVSGTEYLVFTQATPGGPWLNAVEPYVLGGAATPQVALGPDGLASAVDPNTTSLAVMPAQISAVTAAALDGAPGLASPGDLADRLDETFWRRQLPSATVTDRHAPGDGGHVFGLRTTDGGALLFYTDTAELTLVPPAGEALHLTIPGFYSPGQALSRAGIGYTEQFATYVPPRGRSGPRVVADYSGITGKN